MASAAAGAFVLPRCVGGIGCRIRSLACRHVCENWVMAAVVVQSYLARARDFLKGMEFLQNDLAEYRSSSALLGIHSAISYSDALRSGMGSADVSLDDHGNAAQELKRLLTVRRFDRPQGADRLSKLLGMKSRVEYSSDTLKETTAKEIIVQAERFAAWAEETGTKLQIEGW